MLAKLATFIRQISEEQLPESDNAESLQLAVAVLLVEVSMADFKLDADEQAALSVSLSKVLDLPASEIDELIEAAHERQALATSFHEHTRHIVEHYNTEQKLTLMTALWEIAYADGRLDSHEEHVLRKIADLIYVRHSEFIKTKLAVLEKQGITI